MSRGAARSRRSIAVVTGTRAEYGLLTSTLHAIQAHPRLQLQLVVTGMHLLRKFGYTAREIERDGWPIAARVRMQSGDDSPGDQAAGLARGVAGIARFLEQAHTDMVVVLGDRIEATAGALAAVTTGRVLAHIHGGDVAPGDFDDALRHAITKLAHVHFAATRDAARRIIRMGEDPHRVHIVGAPGLDRLRELLEGSGRRLAGRVASAPCRRRSGRSPCRPSCSAGPPSPASTGRAPHRPSPDPDERPTALVIYHAWGRPATVERRTMTAILDAVARAGLCRVILYPNTDRGHTGVLAAIDHHVRRSPASDVRVVRSLSRDDYLRTLIAADVLIGNSSSGVIEAPFAGTPSIDVGGRQAGRLPGGSSIVHADETPAATRTALSHALRKLPRPLARTPYGDGRAGERITRILAGLRLNGCTVRKLIAY